MASFASFQQEIEQYTTAHHAANLKNAAAAPSLSSKLQKVHIGGGQQQQQHHRKAAPADSRGNEENEGAIPKPQQHEDGVRDDGRTILERLLSPTEASTASLASLLNRQVEHSQGEILLSLSSHNLSERSLANIFEVPDHRAAASDAAATPASSSAAAAAAPTPIQAALTKEQVGTVFSSIKSAATEVSLYASILSNPYDEINHAEAAAIARYAPETAVNDDDIRKQYEASSTLFVLVRAKPHSAEEILELRIASVGNVDAGKSTLLSVLSKGRLDDGRGKARVALFRHKHEIETGRTSSVGMEILGFNHEGKEVAEAASAPSGTTTAAPRKKDYTWDEICKEASKVVGFIDLAGHERYFKCTIGALSSTSPDFVLLIVGANAGITGMSKEHLSVALALNVPVVCVVTKIDSTPPNVLDTTIKQLGKILRSPGCRKVPVFVKDRGMSCSLAKSFVAHKACPIFLVSNVTGDGLGSLKCFLNALSPTSQSKFDPDGPLELSISDVFSVPFVGCVVSGVLLSGRVKTGDQVLIGPDSLGQFIPTSVRSIERKRVRVAGGEAGQSIALALKRIRRSQVRKGMVLLSPEVTPKAVTRFTASVLILYHNSTIARGYQAMAHIGSIRQTVKIVDIDKPFVRTGDRATVLFEFIRSPEYCRPGSRILFREGKTKGLGVITSLDSEIIKPIAPAPK